MVLKVPRLNSSPLALCDRPFSLLGFGDILVPGNQMWSFFSLAFVTCLFMAGVDKINCCYVYFFPGLLVAYCHRFDILMQSSRIYFVACTIGKFACHIHSGSVSPSGLAKETMAASTANTTT